MKPQSIPAFCSTKPSSHQHKSAGQLVEWLERYVNALYPDNGIENWYIPRPSGGEAHFGREDLLPGCVHHIASYVSPGSNEGHYIYIGLVIPDGRTKQLTAVKSFGGADECWAIARLCSEALTAMFWFGEMPRFVELWLKLPRDQSWHRRTSLIGEVRLRRLGMDRADLLGPDGAEIDARRFPEPNAALSRDAYLADWATLLRAQGLSVREEQSEYPQ